MPIYIWVRFLKEYMTIARLTWISVLQDQVLLSLLFLIQGYRIALEYTKEALLKLSYLLKAI